MNHGSIFSGIGGFEYAAKLLDWENIFNVEKEDFCRQVLKYHYPNAKQYENVEEFRATDYAGRIDILTGGFPCQPFSAAGKRKGTADERYLWDEMLRVIRECAPRYVVAENVSGLVNWNGGEVFEIVCADLEGTGYEVLPLLFPAAGAGAPQKRERVFFIAYLPDSHSKQLEQGHRKGKATGTAAQKQRTDTPHKPNSWEAFPRFDPICSGINGLSAQLHRITFSRWRKESVKAYGNAVVPQVALQIFRVISAFEAARRV